MITVISGSRTQVDRDFVNIHLTKNKSSITRLIHGDASGVDTYSADWCHANKIPVTAVPAVWKKPNGDVDLLAGMKRNKDMLERPGVKQFIGLWNGISKGTSNAIRLAIQKELDVKVYVSATTLSYTYYKKDECVSFHKLSDPLGFLSNFYMKAPFKLFNGTLVRSSEHLYQSLKFSNKKIQKRILAATSPKEAKHIANRYASEIRDDWIVARYSTMWTVLLLKLYNNKDLLHKAREMAKDLPIVEISSYDHLWGTLQYKDGFIGGNVLGKLLTQIIRMDDEMIEFSYSRLKRGQEELCKEYE